jgi:hypothetical protein
MFYDPWYSYFPFNVFFLLSVNSYWFLSLSVVACLSVTVIHCGSVEEQRGRWELTLSFVKVIVRLRWFSWHSARLYCTTSLYCLSVAGMQTNNPSFSSVTSSLSIYILPRCFLGFSWVIYSCHLNFKILEWHFISKASNLLISACHNILISHACNAADWLFQFCRPEFHYKLMLCVLSVITSWPEAKSWELLFIGG